MMRWLYRLQPVFFVVALLFLFALIYGQWDNLRSLPWEFNAGWLALSAGFLALAWLVEVLLWLRILRIMAAGMPLWSATRTWFLSAIVRYIPGNIWQPMSITVYSQERGIPYPVTLMSLLLFQITIILAVAPIAALYFTATGNWGLLTGYLSWAAPWLIALGLAPLVFFLVRPSSLIAMINWVLARTARKQITTHLTRLNLLGMVGIALVDWLLWGCAFAALGFGVQSYTAAEMVQLAPHLVAAYPIAYAIGFLSFITPSGIGVREGAFYLLLAPIAGAGLATILGLAMRVWTTLGELVGAGLALLFRDDPDALADAADDAAAAGDLNKGLA
jgi:uncharacterized membrane protein YbhN (UPF0104 family)